MTEETIVMTWGDTEDERFRVLAKGTDDARPRIMVLGEPPEIVEELARAFSGRRWDIVVVDDFESAVGAIAEGLLSAVILPVELAEAAQRRLFDAARDRHPAQYLPSIAYTGGGESDRARAWMAGCDGFVPYSAGPAALCREVTTLLAIARDIEPILSRVMSTHAR